MNSNNLSKKINRKHRRHQHVVHKETGVTCTDSPTKYLAICNIGQINGLTEEIIIENFHGFGFLEHILLIPGKSCAFICYKNVEDAMKAFESTNGKLNIAQGAKPIFLSYVEALPQVGNDKIYDKLPQGLTVIENFITEVEENLLLSLCDFETSLSGNMKHRQVRHYGYEFRYDINTVDKDKPLADKIPHECNFLWERLPIRFQPDQLTVNCYRPGQGIPSHVDTHSAFEDPILSLSLNADVVMEFKKKETICVFLPRRSLCIMAGESRYAWTHGIVPRKYDFYCTSGGCMSFKRETRISFTFRKLRDGDCDCDYKAYCDSYSKAKIGEDFADKLENRHVHDVYQDIAGHFSETRHKPWPNILKFVQELVVGSILVDVGCGNGKYFGHNKQIIEIGTDRSFELNQLCKDRGFEIFTANCLDLPLKDESADAAISIAVVHHLSTEERRIRAIAEIARILRIGGRALIYVWAKEQVKNREKSTYIKQDRKNRSREEPPKTNIGEVCVVEGIPLPLHTNRTDFSHSDVLVPWKLKDKNREGTTFLRFYHVFEEGELDRICAKIRGVSIVRSYYDQGNYCVLFEKI